MIHFGDPRPSPKRRAVLLALNDIFFFLLGGSAWILINGIYAQLPFIILMFDGDYGVASKITLCVTLSSLLPILLSISGSAAICSTAGNQSHKIDIGIAFILSIALATSLALTIWTEWITSKLYPLMAVTTAAGIVGTTSSILYYPHAATIANSVEVASTNNSSIIAKRQTTAMLFGTATSNLSVAILAMLQQEKLEHQLNDHLGTGTVKKYFAILMILIGLSATGFIGTLLIRRTTNYNTSSGITCTTDGQPLINEESSLMEVQPRMIGRIANASSKVRKSSHDSSSFWKMTYLNSTLNTAQFILNALTFILPGIVPYSVRNEYDEGHKRADALQYLIVFQLVAHTLGVLASSRRGSDTSSGERTKIIVQRQLGCFFLFLWIPMMYLSLSSQKRFGVTIPIIFNTLLNFSYSYCNTSWFHFSVENYHQQEQCHSVDALISVTEVCEERISAKNTEAVVSATSATRIMGTWHQIGATFGSAIAFAMTQSGAILSS